MEILSKWAETEDDETILAQLFEPEKFGFENFEILVFGKTRKIYNRIKGFVELKIRSLISLIERTATSDSSPDFELRPYPDFDSSIDSSAGSADWPCGGIMRIGWSCKSVPVPDVRVAFDKWMKQIAEWNERDEYLGQFEVVIKFSKSSSLDSEVAGDSASASGTKKLRTH